MWLHRAGLIEVARRKRHPRQATQRIPSAPRDRQRSKPDDAAGEPVAGCVLVTTGVFDVPEQMLRVRDHLHVANVMGERQGARQPGARAAEFSLRVPHVSHSEEGPRLPRPGEETAGPECVDTTGGLRRHVL